MKRFFTLITMMMAGGILLAQKPVLTHEAHAFLPGEVNKMKIAEFVEPGPAGENQLWDLSKIEVKKDLRGMVSESFYEDPGNSFLETNVVLNEFGNKFFFNIDQNSLKGYGMISKNGSYTLKFDKPFVKMRYPFHFGDQLSGEYSGVMSRSGKDTPLQGNYHVEADGYGKLILPNGLEIPHTLRVKTVRSYQIGESSTRHEIVSYRWYAQNERFPMAVVQEIITHHGEKSHSSKRAAYKENYQISNDLQENSGNLQSGIKLYPNPVMDKELKVSYTVDKPSRVLIELYDNAGKKLATLLENTVPSGQFSIQLNTDDYSLSHGTYQIRYVIDGKSDVKPFIKL
jgi:hypothetical protein